MTGGNRAIGLAVALAVTSGLMWASTAPLTPHRTDAGLLRLTWSARPERIETCRPQTDEELARLPTHMRRPIVCTGESAAYRLHVRRNGTVLTEQVVYGGGWRRDRPLYVFHEIWQPPGEASVSVEFERIDPVKTDDDTLRPQAGGQSPSDLPARLRLEERLVFRPGAVMLVTYDRDRRMLVAVP